MTDGQKFTHLRNCGTENMTFKQEKKVEIWDTIFLVLSLYEQLSKRFVSQKWWDQNLL